MLLLLLQVFSLIDEHSDGAVDAADMKRAFDLLQVSWYDAHCVLRGRGAR